MHEWALASDFVRRVDEEGRRRGARRITAIRLRIGTLSGVSIEAFRFAFEAAVEGTIIAGDALAVEEVIGASRCDGCGRTFPDRDGLEICPVCGPAPKTLTQGAEMTTLGFTMEDDDV